MKRSALVLFVILLAVILTGCQPAARETNRNDAVAAATPAKERVDPVAIEAEILKLEREWMDAPKTKNGDAVRRVVADDAVLVYPDGTVATKADEVGEVANSVAIACHFSSLHVRSSSAVSPNAVGVSILMRK